MKTKYFILAASLLISGSSMAQGQNYVAGGQLLYMSEFGDKDALNISQNFYSLGTARSTAMAGAFTSLGADISSMSINPAGLGMYRGSDIAFSPSLSISSIRNSRANNLGIRTIDGNRTTLGIGSFGVAFNTYQSARTRLTSFTFGFAYNKLQDFNSHNTYALENDGISIADVYMNQLRGIRTGDMANNASPGPWNNPNIHPVRWGSVLAYKTSLIDPVTNSPSNTLYTINAIGRDAGIGHYVNEKISGSIGEFGISGGFNFGNILYFGATIGIQDLYYKQEFLYEELYTDNDYPDHLNFMQFAPGTTIRGTGYNAKLGLIVRPIPELRVGIAFHTPTYYDLEKVYSAEMYTEFHGVNDWGFARTNDLIDDAISFTSPPRLLTGVSYSVSDVVLLAVDYERVWYNGMRFKGNASIVDRDDFKRIVKADMRAANNIRLGAEVRPMPEMALRFGYGYYDSGLSRKKNLIDADGTPYAPIDGVYNIPVITSSDNYTIGLGYKFGDFYADVAYALLKSKYTEYDLFYYNGDVPDPESPDYSNPDFINGEYTAGNIMRKMSRHNITLTLGFRF